MHLYEECHLATGHTVWVPDRGCEPSLPLETATKQHSPIVTNAGSVRHLRLTEMSRQVPMDRGEGLHWNQARPPPFSIGNLGYELVLGPVFHTKPGTRRRLFGPLFTVGNGYSAPVSHTKVNWNQAPGNLHSAPLPFTVEENTAPGTCSHGRHCHLDRKLRQ